MIRSAPRRLAASTPESPTAPSPTTATVWPASTFAQTAAWWPVAITSESVSSERIISSEWPEPGPSRASPSASGTRTASPWPPSPFIGKKPPFMQAVVMPCRQFGHVPSLKANGAMTRSPFSRSVTSAPTSSTTPMNSWPIGPGSNSESPR